MNAHIPRMTILCTVFSKYIFEMAGLTILNPNVDKIIQVTKEAFFFT